MKQLLILFAPSMQISYSAIARGTAHIFAGEPERKKWITSYPYEVSFDLMTAINLNGR